MSWTKVVVLCVAVGAGAAAGRLSAAPVIGTLIRQNNALARRARHDRLTGVLNRAGFEDAYTAAGHRDRFVVVVDLNAFKSVNDLHGHPAGDQVLAAVGARLRRLAAQQRGWAGRLGGDEFALILPAATPAAARQAAVQATAEVTVSTARTGPLRVSGSAGIAYAPAGLPLAEALTDADIALYHAKHGGRVTVFRPGMAYPRPPAPRRQARDALGPVS